MVTAYPSFRARLSLQWPHVLKVGEVIDFTLVATDSQYCLSLKQYQCLMGLYIWQF